MANCPDTPMPETKAGSIATIARNIEPGNVIFVKILSINSEVCLPGLIPGIKPPCFFILSATSFGLKAIAV